LIYFAKQQKEIFFSISSFPYEYANNLEGRQFVERESLTQQMWRRGRLRRRMRRRSVGEQLQEHGTPHL
jgi:hypothetical protein